MCLEFSPKNINRGRRSDVQGQGVPDWRSSDSKGPRADAGFDMRPCQEPLSMRVQSTSRQVGFQWTCQVIRGVKIQKFESQSSNLGKGFVVAGKSGLTLLLPAYHCREWKSWWKLYESQVAKGLSKKRDGKWCIKPVIIGRYRRYSSV